MQKTLYIDREESRMEAFCDSLIRENDLSDIEAVEAYVEENNDSHYVVSISDGKTEFNYAPFRPRNPGIEQRIMPGRSNHLLEYSATAHAEYNEAAGPDHESIILKRFYADENKNPYYILIKEDTRNIESLFDYTNHVLAGVLISYIVVCVIIIILITGGITKSIRKLTDAVKKIAKKDYSVRYDGKITSDEIGTLATNFNDMADTIQNYINSINNYNFLLKEDNEHLREYDRIRQRFVRNATHEFKTPLAIISSQVEMMNCTEDKEKKEYYYNSVLQEIQKMSELITAILNDPNTTRSRVIAADNVNLSDVVGELCNTYNGLMATKKITFSNNIESDCHTITNTTNIEHVFNNYITNAVKHTAPKDNIIVTLKKNEDYHRLSVYNDGDNLPEDIIDKIWDEFFSDNASLQSPESFGPESSGLGLFIVKEISNIYQTECGVINRENGVEFWFDFEKAPVS